MWRDDAYLLDMLLAARKVCQFTQNVTWKQFKADELLQNGVTRQIQIIGEAARKSINRNIQRLYGKKLLACEIA